MPVEEISEVFLILTFLTRNLAIREGVMRVHFSLQLEARDSTHFLCTPALPVHINLSWRDLLSFPSPWANQSCPLLWWDVDTSLVPAKLRATDWIHTSQITVRWEHPRLTGNKLLEENSTILYYKSLKVSPSRAPWLPISLNTSVWRGLGSRQKPGKGEGHLLSWKIHPPIRGDPVFRQEKDLILKLTQLPTPKKADLALIML